MSDAVPTAVVFDLGGVLVDWDPRYLYARIFDDQATLDRFLSSVCTMSWHTAHDRGRPMAENRVELSAAFPEFTDQIAMWDTHWAQMFNGPIQGSVDCLEALHARGTPLYALSNLPAEKAGHIRENFAFTGLFRDMIISGEEGVAKPDRRIYQITAERAGRAPDTMLLIDDRLENADAARAFGMDAIHFTGPDALRKELAARGLI